ncbi:uncharacterized protein STEHIDRAFT_149899 [Stereum hirsutum FP-91666 SS1]|uniref:uncharacterized protein n=1 Tax=Stereum hirsutum (strain FP-91666) TaxID=721885 RepID=UPI00044494BC|nr:uncharacterized protein STEHIDRAFT_149899 [Stereum hirsutum FP-91666 SS1]EIM81488.1 hypothetical protein STEHIDRAFT_149899 [Stereum hirsutum FP-91666 SS1]
MAGLFESKLTGVNTHETYLDHLRGRDLMLKFTHLFSVQMTRRQGTTRWSLRSVFLYHVVFSLSHSPRNSR